MIKKGSIVLILIVSIYLLFCNIFAVSFRYEWENSIVHIPVGSPIEEYKYIPKAYLYKNNIVMTDANITYLREGDWLYYLSDVDTSRIGEYEVWYKAYENTQYRPGTCPGYKCKIKFIVEDTTAPMIEILNSNVKLRRNSTYNLLDNVKVSDNYDIECKVISTSDVDFKNIGTYYVNIFAEDGSCNSSTKDYVIEIFEDEKPIISYKNEGQPLKVPLNGDIKLSDYFYAYDEVDGDLTKYIKYPMIDTTKIGEKYYTISVENFAHISNEIEVLVIVIDDQMPKIEFIGSSPVLLDYEVDLTTYNFLKHIKITDNSPIDYNNLEIIHNISNEVGIYQVEYIYTDLTYEVSKILEVKLRSSKKPEIKIEDIKVRIGSPINYQQYVYVYDSSDPFIKDSLVIYDDTVDYSKVGIYYAEAYAINSSGVSNTVPIKVTIEEEQNEIKSSLQSKEKNNNEKIFNIILITLVVLLIGIIVFQTWKIKKHKSI